MKHPRYVLPHTAAMFLCCVLTAIMVGCNFGGSSYSRNSAPRSTPRTSRAGSTPSAFDISPIADLKSAIYSTSPTPLRVPGKIYVLNNYLYINERGQGVHVIDNTDPWNPKNIAFIEIPGNDDIAVKGSVLYANSYSDLAAIDITNPRGAFMLRRIPAVFTQSTGVASTPETTVDAQDGFDKWWRTVRSRPIPDNSGSRRPVSTVADGSESQRSGASAPGSTASGASQAGNSGGSGSLKQSQPTGTSGKSGGATTAAANPAPSGNSGSGGTPVPHTYSTSGNSSSNSYSNSSSSGNNAVAQPASGRSAATSTGSGSSGKGGSTARLTIVGNYLYAVSSSDLKMFSIADPYNPVYEANEFVGQNIETIFPYQNKLFVGSQLGMYIYENDNPSRPRQVGVFTHARSCDPVVAEGNYAYVTLNGNGPCGGTMNQLDVIDISNLMRPRLVKSYPMTSPHGLAITGNTLFVCDGPAGLKVYDATDPGRLTLRQQESDAEAFDVIPYRNIAIVVGQHGLRQYMGSSNSGVQLISTIPIASTGW